MFLAATKAKLDLDAVLVGGIGGFGQRLADQMVDGWEQGDGDPLLALLRSSRPAALVALGEFLEDQATAPLTRALTAWGCTRPRRAAAPTRSNRCCSAPWSLAGCSRPALSRPPPATDYASGWPTSCRDSSRAAHLLASTRPGAELKQRDTV